ncbi:OLC1v1013216C1 [Oldenlandia corymbosa var. corymbosa]|uniref:OLC1v1013216C1 n=1 Tax=Oldenlandia corymbosa var. corymbosa TaxID=529605 RepID=A0AAV1DXS0_OLDCO|nr:OLC1v1013216C1 [Oldenlandia corymbosa var. corymbosa]
MGRSLGVTDMDSPNSDCVDFSRHFIRVFGDIETKVEGNLINGVEEESRTIKEAIDEESKIDEVVTKETAMKCQELSFLDQDAFLTDSWDAKLPECRSQGIFQESTFGDELDQDFQDNSNECEAFDASSDPIGKILEDDDEPKHSSEVEAEDDGVQKIDSDLLPSHSNEFGVEGISLDSLDKLGCNELINFIHEVNSCDGNLMILNDYRNAVALDRNDEKSFKLNVSIRADCSVGFEELGLVSVKGNSRDKGWSYCDLKSDPVEDVGNSWNYSNIIGSHKVFWYKNELNLEKRDLVFMLPNVERVQSFELYRTEFAMDISVDQGNKLLKRWVDWVTSFRGGTNSRKMLKFQLPVKLRTYQQQRIEFFGNQKASAKLLKQNIDPTQSVCASLPVSDDNLMTIAPEAILQRRTEERGSQSVKKFLIRWMNLIPEEASLEDEDFIRI